MKQLSEIKGERSFDVLAEILEPVTNIAADKESAELFGLRPLPEGMTVQEYVLQRVKKAIPALMRRHKNDLITILSLLSDMSEEEYKKQLTLDSVMLDLTSLLSDPVFNAFFTIPQSMSEASVSASENTEE